jgi:hypothetical protein
VRETYLGAQDDVGQGGDVHSKQMARILHRCSKHQHPFLSTTFVPPYPILSSLLTPLKPFQLTLVVHEVRLLGPFELRVAEAQDAGHDVPDPPPHHHHHPTHTLSAYVCR